MEEIIAHYRPIKKARLNHDANDDGRQTLQETMPGMVQELIQIPPQDIVTTSRILQEFLTMKENDDSESWATLQRLLTLRLGYLEGSKQINNNDTVKFLLLSIQCLQKCHHHCRHLDPSETLIMFDTVVRLMKQSWTTMATPIRQEFDTTCLGLLETWFNENNSDFLPMLLENENGRASLEQMVLTLIQMRGSSFTMADRISNFLETQQEHTVDPLFTIALQELHGDKNGTSSAFTDEDWLFEIRCKLLKGKQHTNFPKSQRQRFIQLLANDTMLSAKGMDVVQHYVEHFSVEERAQCIAVILDHCLCADENNDYSLPSSEQRQLLSVLDCLNVLLGDLSWDSTGICRSKSMELLEWCCEIVLGDFAPPQGRDAAADILLRLSSKGMKLEMLPRQKAQYLGTMAQILRAPLAPEITSEAVTMVARWILEASTRRTVLQLCPELLVSAAHLVCSGHASEDVKLQISNMFWKIVSHERDMNLLALDSKILESIVGMATTGASATNLESFETRNVAMATLLALSENPCHRRVLVKHPGLLSSMIHFVRHLPNEEGLTPADDITSRALLQKRGDMKRQILVLAKAL